MHRRWLRRVQKICAAYTKGRERQTLISPFILLRHSTHDKYDSYRKGFRWGSVGTLFEP